jgi:hypothetical protein
MRKKVITILAAHDSLRAEERGAFVSYLETVFAQAEGFPALKSEIQQLQSEVAALKAAAKQ